MHFDQFGISFETCTMILMQLLYAARSMGLLDLIRKYIKSRVVYIPALWAVEGIRVTPNTATQFK